MLHVTTLTCPVFFPQFLWNLKIWFLIYFFKMKENYMSQRTLSEIFISIIYLSWWCIVEDNSTFVSVLMVRWPLQEEHTSRETWIGGKILQESSKWGGLSWFPSDRNFRYGGEDHVGGCLLLNAVEDWIMWKMLKNLFFYGFWPSDVASWSLVYICRSLIEVGVCC
jgi:hypothetical protein